ncbi:MAG: hypothetical protein IJI66_06780 [Erysipelotrichaceae bacterium]|nr:hypothetical protein [Erysipelotrichaceae bacterium]
MKKIITLLLVLMTAVVFAGCQKKQIVAMINYSDPSEKSAGMQAEMKEKSTLKDLFDSFAQGETFEYVLDDQGKVTAINGYENGEAGNWEVTLNGNVVDEDVTKVVLSDGDVCDVKYIAAAAPVANTGLLGGWTIADVSRTDLADDEQEIWNKAVESLLGVDYEPVTVLATQVVSGTNYAFLAHATTVTAEPVSKYVIMKVYKDLEGNVSVSSINDIDVTDIKTREDTDDNIVGGWEVTDTGKPGTLGSEEAQSSFDQAMEKYLGVAYNPIQLLASQVVNGTNYIAMARGKVMSVEDKPELYIVRWYADLNGNSEVTEVNKFDLNSYVD